MRSCSSCARALFYSHDACSKIPSYNDIKSSYAMHTYVLFRSIEVPPFSSRVIFYIVIPVLFFKFYLYPSPLS